MKNKIHWVNLHFKDLAIEVMGMSTEEKGLFLDQIIIDLSKGKSENDFIKAMIEESKEFYEKKSKAGKKSAEIRAKNKVNNVSTVLSSVEQCCNDEPTHVNTPSTNTNTITNTITKENKDKILFVDSAESREVENLINFWNSLSWTKKMRTENASAETKKKRLKIYLARKKDFKKENDGDFLSALKESIEKHNEKKDQNWFTLLNILSSSNKLEKLLSGFWLGYNDKSPRNNIKTTNNGNIADFYRQGM